MRIRSFISLSVLLIISVFNAHAGIFSDSTKNVLNDSTLRMVLQSASTPVVEEAPDVLHEGLLTSTAPNDSVQRYIDLARTLIGKIRSTQNFITNLNDATRFELPVGISKQIGGVSYDLAIYAVRLKPAYAEVDVLMQIETPQGQTLTFKASAIKFTKKGGIVGDAKLSLVGDFGINFSGDKIQLILHGGLEGEKTFVTINCDGFQSMGLDAEVKFSRDILVPEDVNGNVLPGNVTATFNTTLTNWNDLIVQLSLPSFQIAKMPGMGFSVRDAVFDFSDVRNASNVTFPENYNPDFSDPQLANLWRGVYLRELSVQLPPQFKTKGSTARTGFFGYDLLIDNQGFTGKVVGRNLLPLNNGDMNGWAFSVDSLGVELQKSELIQAGFKGNIVIAVSDEQTPLKYGALVDTRGEYLFNVSPAKNLAFTIWGGSKVELYNSSYLEVKLQDKKFLPKAVLHGKMDIKAKLSDKGQGVDLANISFESLEIQSVKPYVKVGAFSFGSEALQQKMAGFPISIKNVAMKNITDQELGLDFDLLLNLTGDKGGSFAAEAGLTILGTLKSESGRQRWRYKDCEVRKIKIDINGGAFKFNGSLSFYRNDVVYGDGFNGQVKAEFIPSIKVSATAIFGNVSGERYWYADAMASFSPGILIFPGVAFYGFGGGAYNGMKMATQGQGSELGQTASGVIYVPDVKSGLGIKAILNIGSAPSDQAFNGDITFEVAFFRGGGIRTISMTGNAFIATPKLDDKLGKLSESVTKLANNFEALEAKANAATKGLASKVSDQESMIKSIHGDIGAAAGSRGAISARAFIEYDFENRVLHGNFNVNINLAKGIIQGNGDAVLHFAPKEWYVYVGTPDERVYLSLGIGPIRAKTTSYFMVGTKILGSPPPPPEVAKILNMKNEDLDYMGDLNAIGTGAGFAFGSAFDIDTGDLTFLMFYAHFHAGAGFDIMLKNYGNAYCEGSSERIGVNGWYANGQMYAFFMGDIGIRIRVFRIKKKIEILSIGAAAVLQAKLPNPFWMRGIVGGYYRVLGGAVKGNCKFEVTLGKECKIVTKDEGSALDGITVISELTPANGEQDVDVFNTPQVVFNMPVDKTFSLPEDGKPKSFMIKLDYFKIMDEKNSLLGELQWNENHDVLVFNSTEVLPPKKTLKAIVQVSFEEWKGGGWSRVIEDGQPLTERSEISFTTGLAPEYIPLSNVEYSYPIIGQTNFYKEETTEGYIRLKRGQSYLFSPGSEWKQVGRMTDAGGAKTEYGFNHSNGTITFNIPGTQLKTGNAYSVELVNIPATQSGAVDRNVDSLNTKVDVAGETLDMEIRTKKAEGSIEDLQEKSIFSMKMNTSIYAKLADKVNAIPFTRMRIWDQLPGVPDMWANYSLPENFLESEMQPSNYDQSKLIRIEADFTNNPWFNDYINPLIYEGYPINGVVLLKRAIEPMGAPPSKAIYLKQETLYYNLPMEMHSDFQYLRAVCANLSLQYVNERTSKLLRTTLFPYPVRGEYRIKFKYVLPGINKVSSETVKAITY